MKSYMRFADRLSLASGAIASVILLLLCGIVVYDIIMRSLFDSTSALFYEISWHLFDVVFLLGLSYALYHESHVRVDIFYSKYTQTTKHIVDFFSMTLLATPFIIFIICNSGEMVYQSFVQMEGSSDPGGLPYRYIIKSFVVIGFVLLLLQVVSKAMHAFLSIESKKIKRAIITSLALLFIVIYLAYMSDVVFVLNPIVLIAILAFTMLMIGFEIAFVFGAIALLFSTITYELGLESLELLSFRTYGIMTNFTLLAVPLFIFMGLILQKAKIAEDLLVSMGRLFGVIRGGLAVSVILVGAILGASTGIVGASVVMMAFIALPVMLKQQYSPALASGSIATGGTLGQIVPPSVALIILGDQMHLDMKDLFNGAIVPSILLVLLYIIYILLISFFKKEYAPAIKSHEPYKDVLLVALKAMFAPFLLIVIVLGSILAGLASPTESAAIGVFFAIFLAFFKGSLRIDIIKYALTESVKLTSMIMLILIGATAFSLVFNELGGSEIVYSFFEHNIESRIGFIFLAMAIIFILGFFIDFIEIIFIVVPIILPIVYFYDIDPIWFGVLIAMNIQASFLTPPFGFSLFFLKGAAGDTLATSTIYKGALPFILLQLVAIAIVIYYPNLIYIFRG
ncbi:MAG: TRAP transporter large permease subunit [Campylobacterales bacterium]|nr:TRAP transporter large permease subunit [Campylobacterales bacterium]